MPAPRLYLDTNVIIALVETAETLSADQRAVLDAIDAGHIGAVTSELTLAECLVRPFTEENGEAVSVYDALLCGDGPPEMLPITRPVLVEAARMRAGTALKLPDAIHVATAAQGGASHFLTGDRRIRLPESLSPLLWQVGDAGLAEFAAGL